VDPVELNFDPSLGGQLEFSLKPEEHPDNRAARLKLEFEEQAAKRRLEGRTALIEDYKGVAVFVVILVSILALGILCAYEGIFDPNASTDTKRWAQTVLSAVVSGGLSFVVGRKVGK
jgi:hypothetical protein